jgi:glycosyltransferase involved in cell wall biosynthesis
MPPNATPIVSVVIPAYNAEAYITPALKSVLSQTYPHTEVIVVDDGSRDDTARLVQSFSGVRCIQQANAGVSTARNVGAAAATGHFLAFLDADDVWHPAKLAHQVRGMLACPDVALSRTHFRGSTWTPEALAICFEPKAPELITELSESFLNPYFATSSVMVRRSAFEAARGFDTSLRVAEDVDFYLRVLASAPSVLVVTQEVLFKRPVKGSLGDDSEEGYVQLLQVYDRYLSQHPALRDVLGLATIKLAYKRLHLAHARSLIWNGRGQESRQAMARARQFGWDSGMPELWLRTWAPPSLKDKLSGLKRAIGGRHSS